MSMWHEAMNIEDLHDLKGGDEPLSPATPCSTVDEIRRLESMVDRAHEALNELLARHLNIGSEAAQIARRGLYRE